MKPISDPELNALNWQIVNDFDSKTSKNEINIVLTYDEYFSLVERIRSSEKLIDDLSSAIQTYKKGFKE